MLRLFLLIVATFFALSFPSCVSHEDMVYLRDDPSRIGTGPGGSAANQAYYNTYLAEQYLIKPEDNLFIRMNNFQDNSLNFFNANSLTTGIALGPAELYLSSYTVDRQGYIEVPLLGKILVSGKTLNQVKAEIDQTLKPQMEYASATVKLANFRVSVLGEVTQPGVKFIYNEKLTLPEALGYAGGLTQYANTRRVKVLRETANGVTTLPIDLGDNNFASHPGYFLMPNDVIYIEPLKAKALNVNSQTISIILSAISVTTLVANIIVQTQNNN